MVKLKYRDDNEVNYMTDLVIDKSGFIKITEIETGYISYTAPFMFYTLFKVIE